MDKITKESCHVKELHHLLQNKFALGQGKTCNINLQILLQKVELFSTFCKNF